VPYVADESEAHPVSGLRSCLA